MEPIISSLHGFRSDPIGFAGRNNGFHLEVRKLPIGIVGNMRKKFATDIDTLMKEVKMDFYRATGPGGRKKDTAETAVRLRHIPSGVTVIATEHRSQARNRELAFERLKEKLIELNKEKKLRIPTKKSMAAKLKILEEKKKRALKKKLREKVEFEEDMG